jgi:DUF1009 family protein
METIGIIAGNGEFPLILARSVRQGGRRIVAAALEGEADRQIEQLVDEVEWVKIGQLNKLIKVFTSRGVSQALMAGGVTPAKLFKNISLDLRMIALAARVKIRNAETIFGSVAGELQKDGVELLDSRPFLGDAVPQPGCLTRRKPDSEQRDDIAFGLRIAKAVSALDIGQTVVVKRGTVLAVEGFEGTDECIRRGGALGGENGGAVVVKVSKPNHDFRFDIPCVGSRTIDSCVAGQISVLAMEAGRSLLLDRAQVVKAAEQNGIRLVAMATT